MEKKAPVIYLKPTNAKGRTYVYVVSKSKTKVVYLKALGHFEKAYKLLCKWQDEDLFPEELQKRALRMMIWPIGFTCWKWDLLKRENLFSGC